MKKLLKTWTVAAFFAMSLLLSTVSVWAATTYTEGYFNYIIEEESITITYYKGSASEVTVPNLLVGYPVSKLAAGSFSKCTTLRKLNLPDTIMEIEEGALPQGITVVYDSNTDKPESSGVAEPSEDTKKENNTSNSSKNETSDKNSNEKSDSNQEEELDFSIEVVEVTDDMETGHSSGINLDELNASVKNADTAMDKTETDKSFESDPKKTSKADSKTDDTTVGEVKESEEAVSKQDSAEAKEDSETKADKADEAASDEKKEAASKEETAVEKENSKETEKTSDAKSVSDKEDAKESDSRAMVLVVILVIVAAFGVFYFRKKNKK